MTEQGALHLLQITDLHLRAAHTPALLGVDTWHSAGAVLDQALSERHPDALLVTGDVAHDPEPDLYARFHGWLKGRYSGPTLLTPGNHDIAPNMGALLATDELVLDGWRVIALDSHQDDEPQALVSDADFGALKAACDRAADDHVLIATHHPPVPVDCPWLDRDRIQNGPELLEWLSGHGNVRAMVFGHAHQELFFTHRHLSLYGTPSTCFQFEPGSQQFSVDDLKPGYRWLMLHADGSVSSRVGRVADYPLHIDRSAFVPG